MNYRPKVPSSKYVDIGSTISPIAWKYNPFNIEIA